MKLPRLSPIIRLSLGLTSLIVSLLLLLDVAGLMPDQMDMVKQVRNRTSDALAIQAAALLQMGDLTAVGRSFEEVRARDPQILSIALRQNSGQIVVAVGEHGQHWRPLTEGRSTLDHVQVPLYANKAQWGNVEISFMPAFPGTLLGWLLYPPVLLLLCVGAVGFVVIYLYLRRALQYLDPTSAVPERVKHAFDTLSAAILVLDRDARIMMTNSTFGGLHSEAKDNLVGKRLDEQKWLCEAVGGAGRYPWDKAMQLNEPQTGIGFVIHLPDGGEVVHLNMQASPIVDPNGAVRGCLVSIDNVTQMFRVNEELLRTAIELDNSREQIRRQNEELQKLASRDPLTGALNRRAFFDQIEQLYVDARARASSFCCVMTDIDHFKQFNDRYGHTVGDEVIRAMVHAIQARLRPDDFLCRYGGEEFCIVLPGTRLEQATEIAHRLRADVESRAGKSVRSMAGLAITASFGVAALTPEMRDPAELIDRADKALYQSKEAGRNRVTAWLPR